MDAYSHILLATDLSRENLAVAERARDLARRYQAKLSAIHVVEYSPLDYQAYDLLPPDIELDQELVKKAQAELAKLGRQIGIANQDQYVAIGSTKIEILHTARSHGVDLIVLGSHGRRGLALLLGSTANAVLHAATCDVLAVRVFGD